MDESFEITKRYTFYLKKGLNEINYYNYEDFNFYCENAECSFKQDTISSINVLINFGEVYFKIISVKEQDILNASVTLKGIKQYLSDNKIFGKRDLSLLKNNIKNKIQSFNLKPYQYIKEDDFLWRIKINLDTDYFKDCILSCNDEFYIESVNEESKYLIVKTNKRYEFNKKLFIYGESIL